MVQQAFDLPVRLAPAAGFALNPWQAQGFCMAARGNVLR
ncbi:hypothetical protein AX27061_0707 [Achromobacter xylosoxidans NBRC 15126 = ATCC 27061]|nr:hypothetical protein AX27061_0707 [Achromobacter xylosoxidans NBRC 15126 = ATCC 27061]CCH05460.1 hypothetical protein NH44784_014871 [Achromobacter xylosoxidans NH44784-1996]